MRLPKLLQSQQSIPSTTGGHHIVTPSNSVTSFLHAVGHLFHLIDLATHHPITGMTLLVTMTNSHLTETGHDLRQTMRV